MVARIESKKGKRYQNTDDLTQKLSKCYAGTSLRHSVYTRTLPVKLGLTISICHALFSANSLKLVLMNTGGGREPPVPPVPLLLSSEISYPPPVMTSSELHCASPEIVPEGTTGISASL